MYLFCSYWKSLFKVLAIKSKTDMNIVVFIFWRTLEFLSVRNSLRSETAKSDYIYVYRRHHKILVDTAKVF